MLFTKPKEEQLPDFEGMAKMMQNLFNRIIDLEKDKKTHKFYKKLITRKEREIINPKPLRTALHL